MTGATAEIHARWYKAIAEQIPNLQLFDAHTHIGQNDPDGMKQSAEELITGLGRAGAVGAFVFPMHEPTGYPPANDHVLSVAQGSRGLLTAFCRVDPNAGAVKEAERCLDAGAQGIKLHPRAERFTLDHPAVGDLAALAAERRRPILIHAGRGIPALGEHAVALAGAHPDARLILAHAGICDLSWIWRVAPDLPNLLFDSAWWLPADLLALFSLVPPGQIVFASDAPYGTTLAAASFQLRLALQAGCTSEQLRQIASGTALSVRDGESLRPAGPPPGDRDRPSRVLLRRVAEQIVIGTMLNFRGGEGGEMLALGRLSCAVPPELDDAPVFAAVLSLLDAYDRLAAADPEDRSLIGLLILAATVALTPDVALPA